MGNHRLSFTEEPTSENPSAPLFGTLLAESLLGIMRVLIIEQEKTIQNSLSLFLGSQKDYQVLAAASKKEGVSLWNEFPCDLVICSDRLPDGSGLEVLKEFCRQDPRVVSVLMTARNDEHLRQEALKAGIKAYLEKPFDLLQLEEAMGFIRP